MRNDLLSISKTGWEKIKNRFELAKHDQAMLLLWGVVGETRPPRGIFFPFDLYHNTAPTISKNSRVPPTTPPTIAAVGSLSSTILVGPGK